MTDKMTSATVAINAMAAAKRARGEKVYNFAAGDPVIPSDPHVIEAVIEGLHSQLVLYPPVAGLPELRKAAAQWMHTRYKSSFGLENTLVTAGGKFALFAAMQLIIQPGDEVLIPSPYWVSYPQIATLFQGVPVIVTGAAENQWKVTPEQLKQQITARSKILILNNPGNPTGNLYSREELQALLTLAEVHNILVIADEVYSEMVYDDRAFVSCGELSDRVLVIQSCSKNFAMTGWRIGFAFGPKSLIDAMIALQGQSTTGACLVSQWAALAALKHSGEISTKVRAVMQKRRDVFLNTFGRLFHCQLEKPAGALYLFVPIDVFHTPLPSSELCTKLMASSNIACVPGEAFGQEGYIRMAFSEEEEKLEEGLMALHQAVIR